MLEDRRAKGSDWVGPLEGCMSRYGFYLVRTVSKEIHEKEHACTQVNCTKVHKQPVAGEKYTI